MSRFSKTLHLSKAHCMVANGIEELTPEHCSNMLPQYYSWVLLPPILVDPKLVELYIEKGPKLIDTKNRPTDFMGQIQIWDRLRFFFF